MSTLPPELANLDAQYSQLTDAVEAGHISVENAVAALDAMIVMDPLGGVWRIDADGDFTRAASHGAPTVKTDPASWPSAPEPMNPNAGLAPMTPAPNSLFTPPVMQGPGSMPADPVPGAPAWALGLGGQPPLGPPPMSVDGFETPKHLAGEPEKKSRRSKAPKAPKEAKLDKSPRLAREPGSGPVGWLRSHVKLLAIIVFAVVLVGAAYVGTRGSSSSSGQDLPAPSASSDEFTTDEQPPASEPSDPGTETPPAEEDPTPAPPATPSADDLTSVMSALASGPEAGAALIVDAANTKALAAASIVASGADVQGYTVTASKAVKGKKGAVTQEITVATSEGSPVLTAAVTWKFVDGTWKLATPPRFK